MAHGRVVRIRFVLPCLLIAVAALSGCGIQIQTLAQSPLVPATPATPFGPAESASHIFSPCIAATAQPLAGAASAISELLLGPDRFRTECAHNPDPKVRFDTVVERDPRALTPQPVVSAPADPPAPGVLVTDELVGAVLTGTSEYWYQPVIGPA
jgi:hypothetical protein